MPLSIGQPRVASQCRSPVASQYWCTASEMSALTWISSWPVLANAGVSSLPRSALSHGYRAPLQPVFAALAQAASQPVEAVPQARPAMAGSVASSDGYIHVSESQKTWPL